MNLVRISKDVTIDKDKLQALVSQQHNGIFYTHIYLMGDRKFLVKGYIKDIEELLNGSEDK